MGSIDVPIFCGEDTEMWVEWIFATHSFTDFETRQFVYGSIKGDALSLYGDEISRSKFSRCDDLKVRLLNLFSASVKQEKEQLEQPSLMDSLKQMSQLLSYFEQRLKGKEDAKKSQEEKKFVSDDAKKVKNDDGGDDLIMYSNHLIRDVKSNMLILEYPVMVQEKDDPETKIPLFKEDNSLKTEMVSGVCQVFEKIFRKKKRKRKRRTEIAESKGKRVTLKQKLKEHDHKVLEAQRSLEEIEQMKVAGKERAKRRNSWKQEYAKKRLVYVMLKICKTEDGTEVEAEQLSAQIELMEKIADLRVKKLLTIVRFEPVSERETLLSSREHIKEEELLFRYVCQVCLLLFHQSPTAQVRDMVLNTTTNKRETRDEIHRKAGVIERPEEAVAKKVREESADAYNSCNMKVDRHRSDKRLEEMSKRNWHTLRKDFNISYKGSRTSPGGQSIQEQGLKRTLGCEIVIAILGCLIDYLERRSDERHGFQTPGCRCVRCDAVE
ncbi:hypothetical protein Bca4012_019503 [Brassica carinata]|uniref:Uncharacterized protein n=1 Tax=Brassica carinata TaxID=52824 RepID=A0A8X7WKJ0_BRACI|nr:hypothetical protein Bca52824_002100 [Brassica carinata]